jgi:TRAP-type transport system periplasmic protein
MGDEGAMVAKMKSGQLDAGAFSTVGLSKIYKPIGALGMPGLFANWAKLDAARDALKGEFEKGVKDAGFTIAGWSDIGVVRQYSKGFAIKVPDDLRGKKPFLWRDDASVHPAVYQTIGGVSGVPLNIPEVLPNLNTGAINALWSPSLLGEQLQWTSKLDNVLDHELAYAVGAVVLSSKKLDALPQDLRIVFSDMGRIAAAALTARIRSEDAAAYMRIKSKMTVSTPSADEKAKWAAIFSQTRKRLAQGTFTPELVTKLEKLSA